MDLGPPRPSPNSGVGQEIGQGLGQGIKLPLLSPRFRDVPYSFMSCLQKTLIVHIDDDKSKIPRKWVLTDGNFVRSGHELLLRRKDASE